MTGSKSSPRLEMEASPKEHPQVELSSLISLFYAAPATLAEFEQRDTLPAPFDDLLDHNHHMTVTVEAFHGDEVDVIVHRSRSVLQNGESVWQNDPKLHSSERLAIARSTVSYCREITLVTHVRRSIVQYGIVRLNPAALQPHVWLEIASGEMPLGKVLIKHNVLRTVELCRLFEVRPGVALAGFLKTSPDETVFGRTALIRCNNRPAIELLEIVR